MAAEFGLCIFKNARDNATLPGAMQSGLTDGFEISTNGMDKISEIVQRMAKSEKMARVLVFLCNGMA